MKDHDYSVIPFIFFVILLLAGISATCYFIFKPKEIRGNAMEYSRITLQLEDDVFYNVRVPRDARLISTDGTTIYSFDLLTIGVQDIEPTESCKVKIGNRWVYAASKDDWLKPTMRGFEEEVAYSGGYDIEETKWEDSVPPVVMELNEDRIDLLKNGSSIALGGAEFVTSKIEYGTYDMVFDRALRKMSTLYKQPILYGMNTGNRLWVTNNGYTVAIAPINYNTQLVVTSFGEEGKQYAAYLMGG